MKNIIFDLGGVLLNIDYKASEVAFAQLGLNNYADYFKQDYSSELFELLETGAIDTTTFYDSFRDIFNTNASSNAIKEAWNAMLGNFIPANLDIVANAASKYRVYLFSNTNQIHYDGFREIYQQQFGNKDFDKRFINAYYSHICGWRKPHPQAYKNLLDAEGLIAEETLFIDDTQKNIIGANEAGLNTFHLTHPSLLATLNL